MSDEATTDDPSGTDYSTDRSRSTASVRSRQGTLAALGGLGVAGLASQPATAAEGHLGDTWSGDPGTHGLKLDVGPGTSPGLLADTDAGDGEGAGTTHVGPMAEDFHDAFDVGDSDRHINSINADGVAFAAIQSLSAKLDEKDERIEDLETELDEKDDRVEDLETELDEQDQLVEDPGR